MEGQANETRHICQECNAEFFGRKNQKFCSRMCKSAHNNRLTRERTMDIGDVNRVLYKNWTILKSLAEKFKPEEEIDKSVFDFAGYNFKYHTHTDSSEEGKIKYCYNFGVMKAKGKGLRIIIGEENPGD